LQINDQYETVVQIAAKHRDQALKELEKMTTSMSQELTGNGQRAQHYVDSLIQLQQRVNHAMGSANHADVVAVEKVCVLSWLCCMWMLNFVVVWWGDDV
jgi:hypothetical protein